jgi:hypothetical protein
MTYWFHFIKPLTKGTEFGANVAIKFHQKNCYQLYKGKELKVTLSFYTICQEDFCLYWAVKMLIFLAALAKITNQPKSKQITFHKGDFYVPQVSINCLTCPKGVKYKQISNEQAVPYALCNMPVRSTLLSIGTKAAFRSAMKWTPKLPECRNSVSLDVWRRGLLYT